LHRTVAGLAPAEPGYRVIRVAPQPLPELDHAAASLETPYGLARVGWRRQEDRIVIDAVIPPNTSAEVILPGSSGTIRVGSGTHNWSVPALVQETVFAPVGESTPLADIIDDPAAYETIWRALEDVDPALATTFRTKTRWTKGFPLSEVLHRVPLAARNDLYASLSALSDGR
jgi:alpha-L-rhamnosidase